MVNTLCARKPEADKAVFPSDLPASGIPGCHSVRAAAVIRAANRSPVELLLGIGEQSADPLVEH